MIAARAALIACSVLAVAWYAVAVRADRDLTHVSGLIAHAKTITAVQAATAQHDLDRAATLDPDHTVDVLRSQVALHAGQRRQAVADALRAVHDEPQNANNWVVLEVASFGIDPALNRLAQAELHRLVPPVG